MMHSVLTIPFDLDPGAFDALAASRWSPYAYAAEPVACDDLRALFDAARTAPSSRNEQPWRFVVGRQGEGVYDHVLAALAEANQAWARHAPVLGVAFVATHGARDGRPNESARYDLGAAMALLALSATSRGLQLHQMGGFDRRAAEADLGAPEGFEGVVAFALGYPADEGRTPEGLSEGLAARDRQRRERRRLHELVFGETWGEGAAFLDEVA